MILINNNNNNNNDNYHYYCHYKKIFILIKEKGINDHTKRTTTPLI